MVHSTPQNTTPQHSLHLILAHFPHQRTLFRGTLHFKWSRVQIILRRKSHQEAMCSGDPSVPRSRVFQKIKHAKKQSVLVSELCWGVKCLASKVWVCKGFWGAKVVSANTLLVIQRVPILPWFLSIGKTCLMQMFCKWNNFKCKQLMSWMVSTIGEFNALLMYLMPSGRIIYTQLVW